MNAPRARLEIRVDEVVVRGLSAAEARVAVAALEAGLGTLAQDRVASGMPIAPRDEPFRRAPAARLPDASAVALGASTAASVWAAIAGDDRR